MDISDLERLAPDQVVPFSQTSGELRLIVRTIAGLYERPPEDMVVLTGAGGRFEVMSRLYAERSRCADCGAQTSANLRRERDPHDRRRIVPRWCVQHRDDEEAKG